MKPPDRFFNHHWNAGYRVSGVRQMSVLHLLCLLEKLGIGINKSDEELVYATRLFARRHYT
jgi:hypothetical protein